MKKGEDGLWRTVGGIVVSPEQQAELNRPPAAERIREVVLSHCDGTFPGSSPTMPEMNTAQVEQLISELQAVL